MIDMHHIVANLELLNLLEREGHLTTTGLVALQIVLMEAVEDLMISKDANTEVFVSKTLMKRAINARKCYFCRIGKNII